MAYTSLPIMRSEFEFLLRVPDGELIQARSILAPYLKNPLTFAESKLVNFEDFVKHFVDMFFAYVESARTPFVIGFDRLTKLLRNSNVR